MTPEQLEHLCLLKKHLENLLACAAKRTPGEWGIERTDTTNWIGPMRQNGDGKISIIVCDTDRDKLKAECIDQNDADAAFIASCAGNAEAGWRSTLAAIEWILTPVICTQTPAEKKILESILAEWPLASLKP